MAVQESREQLQAVIKNSGLPFPAERLTVNMTLTGIFKGSFHCRAFHIAHNKCGMIKLW